MALRVIEKICKEHSTGKLLLIAGFCLFCMQEMMFVFNPRCASFFYAQGLHPPAIAKLIALLNLVAVSLELLSLACIASGIIWLLVDLVRSKKR